MVAGAWTVSPSASKIDELHAPIGAEVLRSSQRFRCSARGGAVEVGGGEIPRPLPDLCSHDPTAEVVGSDVDPAVEAGEAGLIGRIGVRRPLQEHVVFGPELELEVSGRNPPLTEAPREVSRLRSWP